MNGPGEARDADLGIAAGNKRGHLFVKGRNVAVVPEDEMVDALVEWAEFIHEHGADAAMARADTVKAEREAERDRDRAARRQGRRREPRRRADRRDSSAASTDVHAGYCRRTSRSQSSIPTAALVLEPATAFYAKALRSPNASWVASSTT